MMMPKVSAGLARRCLSYLLLREVQRRKEDRYIFSRYNFPRTDSLQYNCILWRKPFLVSSLPHLLWPNLYLMYVVENSAGSSRRRAVERRGEAGSHCARRLLFLAARLSSQECMSLLHTDHTWTIELARFRYLLYMQTP